MTQLLLDKRALKILFDTYWSAAGWRRGASLVKDEDFAYAKSQGVMFDPVVVDHDEVVRRVGALVKTVDLRQVVDGFLASLSTRRLDWRSALGSYCAARWLPDHSDPKEAPHCRICGMYPGEVDLSVMNFERHKWGGVRHAQPHFAEFDLRLFLSSPPPPPVEEDLSIFRDLVAAISNVAPNVTSAQLHSYFPKSLKANKAERDRVVAILGLCGVLGTHAHAGFGEQFVPFHQRVLPERHFVDMDYPACWWKGSDGVNRQRLQAVFGHVM